MNEKTTLAICILIVVIVFSMVGYGALHFISKLW